MIDNLFYTNAEIFDAASEFLYDIFAGKIHTYHYGISELDKINPVFPGMFTIVAGRTGSGKTRFVRYILANIAREYPEEQTIYLTIENTVRNHAIKQFEDFGQDISFLDILEKAKKENEYRNIDYEYFRKNLKTLSQQMNFDNLGYGFFTTNKNKLTLDRLIKLIEQYGKFYKVWVLDYIQAIALTGAVYDRNQTIADTLRALAIENDIVIVGVAQLNRNADNILSDRPPTINDIEGAGRYEQAAQSIVMLHRVPEDMGNYFLPTNDVDIYLYKSTLGGKSGKIRVDKSYRVIEEKPKEQSDGYSKRIEYIHN